VNDFDKSVHFYQAMFGLDPVKLKPGYAKFDVSEPPLNLTLNYTGPVKEQGALNHLGVQVNSTEAVLQAKQRLQSKGLATFDEMSTDCCYALQDKVWVTDPNGYRWEIFVVKVGDTAPELTVQLEDAREPAPVMTVQPADAGEPVVESEAGCCAPTCCPA
jgi:catechol 2,3-dioxygenase-like lactoylglutathione lyase family enzyme